MYNFFIVKNVELLIKGALQMKYFYVSVWPLQTLCALSSAHPPSGLTRPLCSDPILPPQHYTPFREADPGRASSFNQVSTCSDWITATYLGSDKRQARQLSWPRHIHTQSPGPSWLWSKLLCSMKLFSAIRILPPDTTETPSVFDNIP